jgi:hypothetical protein
VDTAAEMLFTVAGGADAFRARAAYCPLAGREVAQLLSGEKSSSPFLEIPHQTYFFYRNHPWFLPLAAGYYRLRDWLS